MFVESTFQVPYVAACLAITPASRSVSYYISLLVTYVIYIDAYAYSHSGCVLYLQHTSISMASRDGRTPRGHPEPSEQSGYRPISGPSLRRRSHDLFHGSRQSLASRAI